MPEENYQQPLVKMQPLCNRLQLSLGIFATIKSNFNCFGHSYNLDATIENFILFVEWFSRLFSSIMRLTCPISHILEVFYDDLGVCVYIYIYINYYILYIS